jgi:hypothetical protein
VFKLQGVKEFEMVIAEVWMILMLRVTYTFEDSAEPAGVMSLGKVVHPVARYGAEKSNVREKGVRGQVA